MSNAANGCRKLRALTALGVAVSLVGALFVAPSAPALAASVSAGQPSSEIAQSNEVSSATVDRQPATTAEQSGPVVARATTLDAGNVTTFGAGAGTYTVPANVTGLLVEAAAGGGGISVISDAPRGGYGALVRTPIPVTPGETLEFFAGSAGGTGAGGGGGGATNFQLDDADRTIIAGGGGGGSGLSIGGDASMGATGAGGDGRNIGASGSPGSGGAGGTGGDGFGSGTDSSYGGGAGGSSAPFGPVAAGPGGAGQPGIDGVGGTGTGSDSAGSGGGGGWGGGGASGDGESTGGAGGSTGPVGGSGFGATSYGWAPLGSSGEGLDGSVTFTALSPATDVVATPGDASATFSWTEPAQPVEGVTYTVWAQPLAGSNASTNVRTSGETLTGLTNGVPYTITVVASTSTGLATVSETTTVTPTQDALGLLDVAPATGPSTGGQWVHLSGSGFTPNTTVAIGAAATDAVYVSPTSMWAKTAVQQTGAVDVTVVEGASTSTKESAYIVAQEGFSISNVSPTGYTDPGDPVTVTISGSGFVADSQVYFGDQASPVVSVTSATSISAFPPAGIGTVDIKVVAPGGAQAIAPSAYAYTTNRYVCDSTDTNTACADSYRVPSGVEALQITALGSGGTNSPGGLCNESGGDGALVTSPFNVVAGQILAYQLGRTSSYSTGDGGGGGGSTSVEPNTPQQVIAGGGGGAGSCNDGGDAGAKSDGSGSAGSGDWGGGGGSGGSGGQAQQQPGSSNEAFDGRPGFGGPGGDGCDSGSVGGAGIGDGGGGACSGKGGGGGGGYGGGAGGGMNAENPFEGGSGGGGGGSTGPAGTTYAAGGNAGMTGLLTINWLGQPAGVRAQAGDATAAVTWEPALGAPDGTTYEVFVDGAASGQTTSPATISGLTNGITSEIYVQATAGALVTASESVRITPAPLPSISSLSPQAGGTTGGTQVTIEGDNLPAGSSVLFDSVPAEVSGGGGSELVAVAPAHDVGTVDVTVITPNGSRAESTYEYVQGPQITAIEPTQGPVAGGTTVTITGSHFDDASFVEFGGVAAQIDSVSEGEITVTTPANVGGLAEVVVTAQGVESAPVDFGYVANISSISPNSGPAVESGAATISGEGLTEAATVTVGGAFATVTAATPTTLEITLPSGSAGEQAVDVAIDGVAATGDVVFTYQPVVTSVSPSTGHTIGGATVTVAGAGFTPDSTVTFGGVEGTSPDVSEDGTSISVVVPAHAAATVPVVVTSEGEVSTQVIDFTYIDVPVLSSIAPISGTAKGGTPIAIQGEAFADTAVVTLGGEPATDVVVNDAGTSITASTEAHLAGIVPVVVTIGDNSSTQNVSFTYEPVIDSLSPAAGPVSQATTVTVRGAGFAPGSSVQVGSTAATVTSVSEDGQTIEATFPAQAAGIKDVTVNSNSVESSESASFTYVAAPSVSAISPSTGPVTGGADVTITGDNFTADTVVLVGDEPLTEVEVRSSTEIAGTTPAGSAGLQAIAVQTPGGSVVLDDAYTYAPVVTSVNPGAGVQSGGTEITIVGAGFVPSNQVLVCSGACNAVPTAVTIGGIDATDVEVTLDGTTITATTPAGTGTQPIVVTSNEIPASESFSFTYIDPGEPLTPIFGNVTALAGGFDVPVTNYTALYEWTVTASAGSVVINDAGLVSVSGLLSGQTSTVTVTTQREFVASASSSVTGSALRRVPAAPVKGCVVARSSLPRDGVATVMKARCKTTAGTSVKIRLKVGLAPRGDYQVASLIRRKSGLVRVRTYGNPGTVTLVYTARGSSQVLPYRKVVSYRV